MMQQSMNVCLTETVKVIEVRAKIKRLYYAVSGKGMFFFSVQHGRADYMQGWVIRV